MDEKEAPSAKNHPSICRQVNCALETCLSTDGKPCYLNPGRPSQAHKKCQHDWQLILDVGLRICHLCGANERLMECYMADKCVDATGAIPGTDREYCQATKKEWESGTVELDYPIDCPIYQGECLPPWQKSRV